MLIEKEVIRPGTYWYRDQKTSLPRKLEVSPELCRYWNEQGNKMLGLGLTVPVPYEHDFNAHPMTPKDKLKDNAGWVKEYRLKGDRLFSVVDIQDEEVAKKLPRTIRWTSPWINTFTDGAGREWKGVISHLALTTRPRIIDQAPFPSVAAALSMATEVKLQATEPTLTEDGFCLSRAGRLFTGKRSKRLRPRFPIAFSAWAGGVKLADDDMPSPKKKKPFGNGKSGEDNGDDDDEFESDLPDGEKDYIPDDDPSNDQNIDLPPLGEPAGDVTMEELLCDLLNALGVQMPENVGEAEFKRTLYDATMAKIKELAGKGQASANETKELNKAANNQPKPPAGQTGNPLIQQEQQPMYMSLEDINKLEEPLRSVALSMYNETVKAQAKAEESEKILNSLRDSKLKEENSKRAQRVSLLGRMSPKVKADLDAMLALPAMALSLGDGGEVIDPMAQTLAVLEKGLSDMPRLLTTPAADLAIQPQPRDGDTLTAEQEDELADSMARMMGAPPEAKKAS